MKRVFGMVEIIFDICYLVTALVIGTTLLLLNKYTAGIMSIVLVLGDAFHLVPRIIVILKRNEEKMRTYLGVGKQITSITMTIFYLLLWNILAQAVLNYTHKLQFTNTTLSINVVSIPWIEILLYALAAIRIVLCLLPQNRWTDRYPPLKWGISRNIPFFIMGVIIAICYFLSTQHLPSMQFMWLAILLSFAFYLPVVLFSNKNPKVGMFMLPKTCMYVWMLAMCF